MKLERDLAARFENTDAIEVGNTTHVPFAAWVLNKSDDDLDKSETPRLYQVKKVSESPLPDDFKIQWTAAVEQGETANDSLLAASITFLLQKVAACTRFLRYRYREGKIQWCKLIFLILSIPNMYK